jgi:hypothetical protein
VGDGKTDNRASIQKAVDFAKANGKDVYVPEGTFLHNGLIKLDGVDMIGEGNRSVLKAVGSAAQSIELTGHGASLKYVTLDSDATTRGQAHVNAKILVQDATGFTVAGVHILNSHSAGIMIDSSEKGVVRGNTISGTNADSIHITSGSHDIVVKNNHIDDAGDDGIAVVSYGTGVSDVNHDITITGNTVTDNNWGRNISVVGGERVTITQNHVEGNKAGLAGIYLATEPAYKTAGVHSVVVDGNVVLNTGSDKTGHGNIMLYDGTSETISGVQVTNNYISGRDVRTVGDGIGADIHHNLVNTGGAVPGILTVSDGADILAGLVPTHLMDVVA